MTARLSSFQSRAHTVSVPVAFQLFPRLEVDEQSDNSTPPPPPPPPAFSTVEDICHQVYEDDHLSYSSLEGDGSFHNNMQNNITLLEKLIRTHPIWFLPSLRRIGATHLLHNRQTGNFIVRSSTQPLTMAISVKLTSRVEHYLLKSASNGSGISLENSKHHFESVHQLICHYCHTSDEIPVRLTIPLAISQATSRQQLQSLALLGPDFWTHISSQNENQLKIHSKFHSDLAIFEDNFETSLESHDYYNYDNDSSMDYRSFSKSSNWNSNSNSMPSQLRPTTLNLAPSTSPAPPPRWSTSAMLSYVHSRQKMSLNQNQRPKSKTRGNSKSKGFFEGKPTIFDDRASDYEDIWSPNNREHFATTTFPTATAKPFDNDNKARFFSTKSIYSEPFDSLRVKGKSKSRLSQNNHRNSEPNLYWRSTVSDSKINCSPDLEQSFDETIIQERKSFLNSNLAATKTEEWLEYLDPDAGLFQGVKFPVFTPPNSPNQRHDSYRFSRYDNLEFISPTKSEDESFLHIENPNLISKPWDSSKWEHLLKIVSDSTMELNAIRMNLSGNSNSAKIEDTSTSTLNWEKVQSLVRELAGNSSGVFGPTLKTFIACTISAKAKDPSKILGNTRQFMNGMKNYLTGTTSGETELLRKEIQNTKKVQLMLEEPFSTSGSESELCELDLALEEVLIELILRPLYQFIIEILNESNVDCQSTTGTGSIRSTRSNELPFITFLEFRDTSSPLVKLQKLREVVSKVQIQGSLHFVESDGDVSVDILGRALQSLGVKNIKSHLDYTLALLPQSVHQTENCLLSLLQSVSEYFRLNPAL